MTTSGTSFAFTRLPAWTSRLPVRPEIGERICGIIQVEFGAIDREPDRFRAPPSALDTGLGRSDGFARYVGRGTNLVMLRFGDHTGLREFGVSRRLRIGVLRLGAFTRKRRLGLSQLSAVAGDAGLRLTERFPKWPRVDLE